MYNIMSCGGFDNSFMGACSVAWLGFPVLFFVVVFANKFFGEMGWNNTFAFIGAYLPWFLVVTFFGAPDFALLAGVVGALAGGFGGEYLNGW